VSILSIPRQVHMVTLFEPADLRSRVTGYREGATGQGDSVGLTGFDATEASMRRETTPTLRMRPTAALASGRPRRPGPAA
jgi:hypothetical protein